MAATDNIRVAIRVRPLIKRENDFHQPIHWKVDGNTITQLANGKTLPNSSYFFDRIFDMSSSTQDVYDEFGRPTVLSAMDGFNGTLFAYGQTSSGKTHTMMGDGKCQGVIPKAIGEIFDYIEKNPSREFLIRVSYIEIYNEDIKDLLNPARTNLKIHENAEKQVYVGDLTEEVVSGSEDVFKHMMRGEKNRHFGVTNMNDRSSRSHTIFRVVIESREMMDESKTPDTIDGAVRVAHLNLVDLAGSERASQTGAFGQRLKEGGHINKSLLALGSVIAKLSEGESFIPFRDSKLTRILQSSLGGNAKTSMLCTITPAAIEESISTLKFASRAKTIKNCPEVNEVLDDGTLLKRYRKEIRELKQQLVQMSSSSHVQELQLEKEKVNEMEEMLEQQRRQQNEQEEKIKRLCNMICTAGGETANNRSKAKLTKRRETWCPGAGLSKAPLASSTAFSSVKSRLQRIPSSPSSDESEFGEMTKDIFLSTLEEEEDIKSSESGKKRVVFASPVGKRCLSSTTDMRQQEHKEMQTEPDQNCLEMEREVKRLRSDLHEAIETRDFYNELLEESNVLLEKMSTENGRNDTPMTQVSMLKTLDQLRAKNKELQAEFDSVQAEKEALAARVEGLENAGTFNTAAQMKADSLQMELEEGVQERDRLHENLKEWQKKCTSLGNDVASLQGKIANAGQEEEQSCQQEASERIRQLELQIKGMGERLSGVKEQEQRLTEAIEEKVQLEESKKLEVACLEEALDEMTKEKGQLDETLQLWKDKCAGLETNVALSEEEKLRLEEKMACAGEEASEKIKKLEEQVKEMEDRLTSVDEHEGMLTEVIEQKLQLEESHKVEVTSLKKTLASLEGALNEATEEKGRLDEALQQWKDKCASLETTEALSKEEKLCLEEKMTFAREEASEKITKLEDKVKETEERLASVVDNHKLEVTSLKKALEDITEEKLRLEKKMAFAGEEASEEIRKLEDKVKEMEERLASVDEQEGMLTEVIEQKLQLEENHKVEVTSFKKAVEEISEEKLRLEEKMTFAEEEASQKIRKLENQVKEMEKRLACVDEQEGMLTEVIEQKLQLEENHKVEVTSLKKALEEIAQEKESIESWKKKCASLESDLTRLQEEMTCAEKERLMLEESLSIIKEDTSVKMKEMGKGKLSDEDENKRMLAEVTEQKVNFEDIVTPLETEAAQGKELSEETRNIKACFEKFKEEKEAEIMELKKEIQELEDQRNISSCGVEEKDTILEQMIEQKREIEAKMSDLQVQLENVINEKEEYQQLLIQVKKEKDEIKNDLSESISDSAELQKDMLDMQQKVKRYKEHIYELQNELQLRAELITSHEQKCEELQNRLSEALKQLENVSQDMNKKLLSEGQVPDEQHEKETDADDEKFASELSAEKERAQEIADKCNALKLSLENVQNRNGILESEAEETKQEVEKKLQEIKSLELQLVESKQAYDFCKEQLEEQREKCEELVEELNEMKSTECQSKKLSGSFSFELELHKAKKEGEELLKELGEEKKAHETLRKEHTSILEELQHFKNSLLRDTNRGMDQQRLIDKMKAERRETICIQAQQRHELENDLCEAQKKVSELEAQCNFLRSERDVLEHRIEVANKKVEETKQEMRDMEKLYSSHNVLSVTQRDDDSKVVQKLKQMELNVELTKQKCEKAEGRVKELESENRQLKGADIRNGALAEERDSLKQQVQQSKQVLSEKNKKVNELSIEVTQLKAHVDKLTDESKKSRSQLEKKDNKIDQMEQKLWEIEEELKIERRCQEKQIQDSTVEELNSTIQVKHEELEHMTFLLDEKEVEIAEVRTTLQQNELRQSEMTEEFRKNEGKINELESKLEYVNESLLEVKKGRVEAEAKIVELKGIIRQQEAELILVNKKIETQNGENESQSQELALKTEQFEKELEDMQHRLLEVESELEFTKSSLENVDAEKKDLNTAVERALKEKELLEEKLHELTASSDKQKNVLDQEIDEIRESLLKEKNIVSELEDKLLIAEKSRDAAESEMRRVLADQCANVSKEEMNKNISAIMNSQNELRQELEMEKGKSANLVGKVEELTTEKEKWESLAQSKTALLEEENKKWVEEIASMTELRQALEKEKATNQRLESQMENNLVDTESKAMALEEENKKRKEEMVQLKDETEKLLEQLREISALKVKESEDCYAEKNDRIKELEENLATATQTITDCEQSIQHYQLKLAKVEYELETTVARLIHLEKQNSTNVVDLTEVENLRKECEAAKKKAENNLQRYFKESDRLKAIIDEMQDEEEEHLRQIEELEETTTKKDAELTQLRSDFAQIKESAQTSQNSARVGDQNEIDSLRKECDAVKKKAKDTIDKYLAECNRLKAIVDEQQAIIHKVQDVKKIEEEMETLRIELAQKNMQIQSLQYDLYKLNEKYDNETKSLRSEVEWGREKVGSLKVEIRRLKEPETDDTISIMRGQPVASNEKENSEVGVVSNVAIYSLKAKLGKLETETQTLKESVKRLEKEKSTLSLLNTEASNKVAQLCSENNALKTARKKLVEDMQKLKKVQESSKAKEDSVRRLPEASTEALERQSRNSSVLRELSTCSEALPAVERKRVKPEPKENFQNWLSGDAANNMFKDEPNQCANQ